MIANILLDYFERGGPIMWPMLACFLGALFVVFERSLWWLALGKQTNGDRLDAALAAVRQGKFDQALDLADSSLDPFQTTLREGLLNGHTSLLGAMQLRATREIEHAEKRLWVLGTLITLAPLLGLLGTVTGIMGSFQFVGSADLAPTQVSGGIAEALIATACGLGIAILCLLPHNLFHRRVVRLRSRLEWMINHVELLVESARRRGFSVETFAETRAQVSLAPSPAPAHALH